MRQENSGSGNRGGSNRRYGGGGFNRGGSREGGFDRGGSREGGFNRGGFNRGGFNQGPREMHKAICADCNQECEVPFKPTEGKPVYCRDCFQKHKPKRFND
ncbi:MAG: CxxC-x17-CxxC domain-containing protein [Nanoarchaeota archaeon]